MTILLFSGRVLLFLAVPTVYFLLGWLHWHAGGKLALLGAFAVLAVSAWTVRDWYESRTVKIFVLLTAACFFGMFGFHAFLRVLFGVKPNDNNVIPALFGTDRSEAAEFISQYAGSLAKHIFAVLSNRCF